MGLTSTEKMMRTKGYLFGRVTAKQLAYLAKLGVDTDKAVKWTKDKASKEIDRLKKKKASSRI